MPEEEVVEPIPETAPARRMNWRILPWLLVIVPPLITWFLIEEYRFKLPQADDHAFVRFYQNTVDNGIDWKAATGHHNEHRVAFSRLCYAWMFHLFGGDVRSIAVVTYGIVLAISLCLLWLGRAVFRKYPGWGWAIALLVMTAMFTAAQGYSWQWGFIYANHLPWLSVAVGMVLLSIKRLPPWVALIAPCLIAVAATLSFGMGLLTWILIPLFAFLTGRFASRTSALATLVPWFLIGIAVSVYALTGQSVGDSVMAEETAEHKARGLQLVLKDPVHAAWFCFSLLGNHLGKGTEFEYAVLAPIAGAIIFLIIAAAWLVVLFRWRDEEFRKDAAPWLTLGLGAILSTGLVAAGRLTYSGVLAESAHYIITTVYGAVAAVFLLPLLASRFVRLKPLLPALGAAFLVLQAVNWRHGINLMKIWQSEDNQLIAATRFIDVLKPEQLTNINRFSNATPIVRRMREDGQLDWIDFLPAGDASLENLRVRHPLLEQWAALTDHTDDGVVRGYAHVKGGTRPADAVVFTWRREGAPEEERMVFDIAFPLPPDDYFRRRRLRLGGEAHENFSREHYGRFDHQLKLGKLPEGKFLIEAHVMNIENRNVRPMEGAFVIERPGREEPSDTP